MSEKVLILVGGAVVAMSGCAQQHVWMKKGAMQQEFASDQYSFEKARPPKWLFRQRYRR